MFFTFYFLIFDTKRHFFISFLVFSKFFQGKHAFGFLLKILFFVVIKLVNKVELLTKEATNTKIGKKDKKNYSGPFLKVKKKQKIFKN